MKITFIAPKGARDASRAPFACFFIQHHYVAPHNNGERGLRHTYRTLEPFVTTSPPHSYVLEHGIQMGSRRTSQAPCTFLYIIDQCVYS